jgi:hypothetical protein
MNNSELIAFQNIEYEESLLEDMMKDVKKLQIKEEREKIETNISLKKEELLVDKGGEKVNIKFQLPDKNITHLFTSLNLLSDLYDFIYTQDLGENFKLYMTHPKKLIENNKSTLEENNILNRSKLCVYYDI